jgi:hypothetical protein
MSSRFRMQTGRMEPSRFMQKRQIRLAEEERDKEDIEEARRQISILGIPVRKMPETEEVEEEEFDDEEPNVEYKKETEKVTRKKSNLGELRGILSDAWSHLKEAASNISDAFRNVGEKKVEENEMAE